MALCALWVIKVQTSIQSLYQGFIVLIIYHPSSLKQIVGPMEDQYRDLQSFYD